MVGGRGKRWREEERERKGERPSVPDAPAPGDLTGEPQRTEGSDLALPPPSDLHWGSHVELEDTGLLGQEDDKEGRSPAALKTK